MSNSKTPKKRRGWTAKRRQEQAKRCQNQKPWAHNTGPKTPEGKARASGNAYKHGFYAAETQELKALLRAQAASMKAIVRGLYKS